MPSQLEREVDPFDSLGKPVSLERRANALEHLRDMIPDTKTGPAMALIDKVAHFIERDKPYEAQRWATGGAPIPIPESSAQRREDGSIIGVEAGQHMTDLPRLDYTGGLRLFCALLVDPTPGKAMS
jgi:hypothetical protein